MTEQSSELDDRLPEDGVESKGWTSSGKDRPLISRSGAKRRSSGWPSGWWTEGKFHGSFESGSYGHKL